MGLDEQIQDLRTSAIERHARPVPDVLQGVTKERIAAVLAAIDCETRDVIDVVFALLDDVHPSWFGNSAPEGANVCDGATTAHLACHVGILQRGARRLDREGRDYWIKPLRDLGGIEAVYLDSKNREFIPGHPIAKSSNSAYRLAAEFKTILAADEADWRAMLEAWIHEDLVRRRAELQAQLAQESRKLVDTKHSDLIAACRDHYVPRFLPVFEVLYVDDADGKRITPEEEERLASAGIALTLKDAMPDIVLWNRAADELWVIEAVTSDGEVDVHKVRQLRALAKRSGKKRIGFTTAYRTWKDAAARQGRHKNLAPNTYVWIREDPSKHFLAETFPEPADG